MNLQLPITVIISFLLGGLVSFWVFRCEKGIDPPKDITDCHCLDSETVNRMCNAEIPETNTSEMIGYLRNYVHSESNPTDTFGFSLPSEVIISMHGILAQRSEIHGFRMYPGLREISNEGSKLVMIKALIDEGQEHNEIGFVFETANSSLGGPCPNWCGHETRRVKPNIEGKESAE